MDASLTSTNTAAPPIPPTTTTTASTEASLSLVTTTGALANTTPPPPPPSLNSIAEALANIQLQLTAMNNNIADQGARLSAIDGKPAFPRFGMPGFGGIPTLPEVSAPVITEVMSSVASAHTAASPALPQHTAHLPNPQPAPAPSLPPTGVPITQINFPRSPSPIPSFGSVSQPMPHPTSSHMPPPHPYTPPPPEWETSLTPKYHKIIFETYDGMADPLGWLKKCEQFFRGQLTREADKVWLASYHLKSVAQQWYVVLEQDLGRPTWPEFRTYCQERFGPAISTNHLADLA